jgi:hypothetical protein
VKIVPNKRQMVSMMKDNWREGRKVLHQTTKPLLDLIGNVPLSEVKARAPQILDSPVMKEYISNIWINTGSWFAQDMLNKTVQRVNKDENFWAESYRTYIEARVAAKAASIARTQASLINSIIDIVEQEALAEGYSIDTIAEKIRYELSKRLTVIQGWEAERIARTETIGAANKGSFDGAFSSGLDIKKGWQTSGLQGVRPSHASYEGMGFVPMNYEYAWGLKFPGDPACQDPSLIINCRCTIVYET